jgi:long-chain acyl-CoA synthetase
MRDPLFEQVMLIGEAKPYLTAVVVLANEEWNKFAQMLGVDAKDPATLNDDKVQRRVLERIGAQMREFPGHAQVRRVTLTLDPWTVENGLLTPTMKMKRPRLMERFAAELDSMYAGH